jgi:hypothetical protein
MNSNILWLLPGSRAAIHQHPNVTDPSRPTCGLQSDSSISGAGRLASPDNTTYRIRFGYQTSTQKVEIMGEFMAVDMHKLQCLLYTHLADERLGGRLAELEWMGKAFDFMRFIQSLNTLECVEPTLEAIPRGRNMVDSQVPSVLERANRQLSLDNSDNVSVASTEYHDCSSVVSSMD